MTDASNNLQIATATLAATDLAVVSAYLSTVSCESAEKSFESRLTLTVQVLS
jgi:hypothetical protein